MTALTNMLTTSLLPGRAKDVPLFLCALWNRGCKCVWEEERRIKIWMKKNKLLDIRQFGWKWHIHQWLNEHVVKWCFSYSFKNKKIPLKKYSDILIPSHTQYILKSSISYLFIYLYKLYLSYYTKSESKFLWSTSGTIFKVDKTIFSGFLPYISCYILWLYFILATNVF